MAAAVQTPLTPALTLDTPTANQLPRLRSNRGAAVDPSSIGYMRASPRSTPIPELRRRYAQDGYIWLKHLIPRPAVLDMREHYFAHLSSTGILAPGTSPRDGIFNSAEDPLAHHGVGGENLPAQQAQLAKLTEAHASEFYQTFLAHPDFRAFVREFMGWEKEVMVKRNMLRHNVPGGLSTGIHYDQIFLRAGAAEFLTAWVPIGDVAADGGGLTYLEGSAELGREIERDFMERAENMSVEERISGFNVNMARDGQLSHDMEAFGRVAESEIPGSAWEEGQKTGRGKGLGKRHRWLVADYEAGDVVFHNPYMVHGSAKNEDKLGRIRLGSDIRFYEEGAEMDERWMNLWLPNDGL